MPDDSLPITWRVIASAGLRVRKEADLLGERLSAMPNGTKFVQIGPLEEADGYVWCHHDLGYSAVRKIDGAVFAVIVEETTLPGVNLDPRNALNIGKPSTEQLGNINWLRINYDVSFETGNTDINLAFALYEPICRPYLESGKRLIFVLSHETFGENTQGLPVKRPAEFAPFVAGIVDQWKDWNDQIVWEIWNEPDLGFNDANFDPNKPQASIPLTPSEFADLLSRTIQKIREIDSDAILISGGLMRGQPSYLAQTLAALPQDIQLDGIAIHPYGQDPNQDAHFGPHGDFHTLMQAYKDNANGIPLYITEWGVLDQPNLPVADVAAYATRFLDACKLYAECAVWFAWADQMDNGYGLVEVNQNKKQALYDIFAL
jgi:hypothetical protein